MQPQGCEMQACNKCEKNKRYSDFHFTNKYTGKKSLACKECTSIYQKEHYQKNREAKIAYQHEYGKKNAKAINKRAKKYYKENRTVLDARMAEWRKNNPEKMQAIRKRDRERNFKSRLKNHKKRLKMISFSTPKDIERLKLIAEIIRKCPDGYVIDHYYPILGKEVCGLNIPENMQYLSIRENQLKGNKMPTEPIRDNLPESVKSHPKFRAI